LRGVGLDDLLFIPDQRPQGIIDGRFVDHRTAFPRCHPALKRGDLGGRELLLWRHFRFIKVAHRLDERALIRGVRDDSRSALSAFQKRRSVSQPEASFCFLLAVALLAFLDDQRADRLLEEIGRRRVVGLCWECLKRELECPENEEPPGGRCILAKSNTIVKTCS
jgi:hypothetical protein